jgi:hypothetical protein
MSLESREFPFRYRPDVFNLSLYAEPMDLKVRRFVSEWGPTDEYLGFLGPELIGLVVESKSAPCNRQPIVCLQLVPTLNCNRNYPWPSTSEFDIAIASIAKRSREFEFHCERDVDQHPVEQIKGNLEVTIARLQQVTAFCLGESKVCPSFIAR